MMIRGLIVSGLMVVFVYSCVSKQVRVTTDLTPEKYKGLSWDQRVSVFDSLDPKKKIYPSADVYMAAFKDPVPSVVIAALKSLPDSLSKDFKSSLYLLLKYRNPVVRMEACQKIILSPAPEDLNYLSGLFTDWDWMPRECVFQAIRNYSEEKNKKKYMFLIISRLYDKNPQSLRQIYKTLKWYNDPRTLSFMYKRSFLIDNNLELMVIMQEIAEIRNNKFRQRLVYLSLSHPDYFIRSEALRLLKLM